MYPEQIAAREIAGLEAEIERLTADVESRGNSIMSCERHIAEQEVTIERLRAALRYYASGITERGDIARAALGADEQLGVKE